MKISDTLILIIVVSICLSFFINSILFTWEATRRSADDIAKIQFAKKQMSESLKWEVEQCKESGGIPNFYGGGKAVNCKTK